MLSVRCYNNADIANMLNVLNKTDKDLYLTYSFDYPDTTFSQVTNSGILQANRYFPKKTTNKFAHFPVCDLEEFNARIPSGKLIIFAFDKSTVDSLPWDTIVAKNLYYKRYILTHHQLDSMGCILTVE